MAAHHLRSLPEGVNRELLSEYDASPEVLHTLGPGQGDNQKEPDGNNGLEASKGKIWGMKRKVFMIVLGIIAILIIAMAVGVGWGVGVTASKSRNNNNGASESTTSKPQDSPVAADTSYVS